jgi:diguanylate cyclase (GGDEF)-like protein
MAVRPAVPEADLRGPVVPTGPLPRGRADLRVALLTAGVGAATATGLAAFAVGGVALPLTGRTAFWLPVLIAMFAITEGFAVHLPVRRGGHAVSLSEIPMVLAIVNVDPVLAVACRIMGGGTGLVTLRSQRGGKLAFNVALIGVQALVAAATFHVLVDDAAPPGVMHWVASYAGMLLADAVAVVLVTAAISLHDDPGEWRRLPAAMQSVPTVLVPTTIALLSLVAVARGQWAALLLAAVGVVLYLAYRSYVHNGQSRTQIERLYAFTRMLDGSTSLHDLVRVVLDQSRDQLRAQAAELFVPAAGGAPDTRVRMSGSGAVTTVQAPRTPADAWWAPALLGEAVLLARTAEGRSGCAELPTDGMAVPVPFGETTAALVVTESLPDIDTFDEGWLALFRALASHASVSLARASLVDRLRKEAEEKEHQALHDPLTGLANRRQFHELLGAALDATQHDDNGPAVILMDLDRFKEINDALGHDTGDALLQEVSERLRACVDGRGRLARLGGDEFAVLLPRARSVADAVSMANDLSRELERPVELGPITLTPRASTGIAVAPQHGDDAQTLLRRADVAMYAAKDGYSTPRVYLPEDDHNTPQRLALIADLRQAIESHELLVVFQPKLDPTTGRVVGAEALTRWRHPEHGAIPPDQFIPLAEHAGLIPELTLHVLRVALATCAAWRADGHALHIAVNLSPSSLLDPDLPATVARLLREAGLPAEALTLEITENSIMANPTESRLTLERLNALGVRLSIDDFGTGYSSLGRLRELPIHEMKIDKSFIQRTSTDARDRAVVRSAIQLGHALHLHVVAEGVEDSETYAHLTREGCNTIQGYLISRPLTPEQFTTWLESRTAGRAVASLVRI